jgi:predicted DNA-binding protein (MmcQ/YjbR family)
MKESSVLARLRKVCLRLPEVRETVKWGHPTFEAGKKIFAVLDRYDGRPCIAFRAPLENVDELLADERFTEAPYAARFGWVCLNVEGSIDWAEVERLVQGSYRLVALKRMLAAIEERGRPVSDSSTVAAKRKSKRKARD